jgi:hypothetical protein
MAEASHTMNRYYRKAVSTCIKISGFSIRKNMIIVFEYSAAHPTATGRRLNNTQYKFVRELRPGVNRFAYPLQNENKYGNNLNQKGAGSRSCFLDDVDCSVFVNL